MKNGQTTNERGLDQVQHFNQHTKDHTKGVYYLLILNSYKSYHLVDFKLYYKDYNIITLYMPTHSSHKLQPLDVGCFHALKRSYSKGIKDLMQAYITHISKEDFLPTFCNAFYATFTESNICGGFQGVGLVPYDLESIISQLDVKLHTPLPLGTLSSLPLTQELKTLNNPIKA